MNSRDFQVLEAPNPSDTASERAFLSGLEKGDLKDLLEICSFPEMEAIRCGNGRLVSLFNEIAGKRDRYLFTTSKVLEKRLFFIIEKGKLKSYVKEIEGLVKENHFSLDSKGWIDTKNKVLFFTDQEIAEKMNKWLQYE